MDRADPAAPAYRASLSGRGKHRPRARIPCPLPGFYDSLVCMYICMHAMHGRLGLGPRDRSPGHIGPGPGVMSIRKNARDDLCSDQKFSFLFGRE